MIQDFLNAWNAAHPELPGRLDGATVTIPQDRFPYGNITVEYRTNTAAHPWLDCYVNAFDGEEMEPEWLGDALTVEQAVNYAEYGIHPGNKCCVCGAEHKYRFDGFVKLGKKLYCGEHRPA